MKRFYTFVLALIIPIAASHAETDTAQQGLYRLETSAGSTYYQVERSNWSRYENGKYIGLTRHETRANVTCQGSTAKGIRFTGFFYLLEETLKDMTKSAQSVDEICAADFTLAPSGTMFFAHDEGYPQLRNFPVWPDAPVKVGDRWQAEGFRSVDPKNDGKRTLLPILVEYTFIGPETYRGQDTFRLKAKYATRINKYRKVKTDDPDLANATGTHDAEILIASDTGAVILILDRFDETFQYEDGNSLRFKGNTAIFSEYPAAIDRNSLLADIRTIADTRSEGTKTQSKTVEDRFGQSEGAGNVDQSPPRIQPKPQPKSTPVPQQGEIPSAEEQDTGRAFAVEETDQGIRLSVRDLRFEADSDKILAGENWRLDAIAKTLILVPDGHFLVEGHTASVGKPAGEKELSLRRAKKIVDELVSRGLKPEQFIYTGQGGTKPIADNSTAEGRALNRRVEITIME